MNSENEEDIWSDYFTSLSLNDTDSKNTDSKNKNVCKNCNVNEFVVYSCKLYATDASATEIQKP